MTVPMVMIYGLILLVIFLIVVLAAGHAILGAVRELRKELQMMAESIRLIAASKRLSTYLEIERKSGLTISPEQFEANKPVLEARMLAELEEQLRRKNDPGHSVYNVVNRSGFEEFVKYDSQNLFKNALARLLTNNDIDGARRFVQETVAAL